MEIKEVRQCSCGSPIESVTIDDANQQDRELHFNYECGARIDCQVDTGDLRYPEHCPDAQKNLHKVTAKLDGLVEGLEGIMREHGLEGGESDPIWEGDDIRELLDAAKEKDNAKQI